VRDKKQQHLARGGVTKATTQSKATPLTRRAGAVKLAAVSKKSIKKARVRANHAAGSSGSSKMEE